MAKRFTRNIRSIKDIEKQPKNTNQQNDLLSDDKHVYVRNKDQYEQITGGVKEVNGESPDKNGNVDLQIKDFTGQEKFVRKNQLDESLEGIESDYKNYTDNAVEDIDINNRNLLKGTSDEWEEITIPKNFYGTDIKYFSLEELSLKSGDSVTLSEEIDNTINDFDTGVYIFIGATREDSESYIVKADSKQVKLGDSKKVSVTITIPEKTAEIGIRIARKDNSGNKVVNIKRQKLNRGTRATAWTPAPEDIGLKSELEKIKQAIIDLGGSV